MHAVELYLIIIGIWLAWCIQIVIHEAGHLVFGLISGYRFISSYALYVGERKRKSEI